VTVLTVRSGTHLVRVDAPNREGAARLVQAECDLNQCHCPPEYCTNDVQSETIAVHEVVPAFGPSTPCLVRAGVCTRPEHS